MDTQRFLLDTSVVSELAKKRPDLRIVDWLTAPQDFSLALPTASIVEVSRGIELLRPDNPIRAAQLDEWLETLLASDVHTPLLCTAAARLYGRMTGCRALKHLWISDPRMKAPKMGLDLMIASQSIVESIPIATLNSKDFLSIHQLFPLPGLFHPGFGDWIVNPMREWMLTPSS